MPLPPSRRDTIGPPPRDVSDLAARVRHQGSYLRSLDPGIQEGRWRTPSSVPKGAPPQLVGGDAAGDDTDYAWEFDDRHTITSTGTQSVRLSHIPIDESLQVFWHPGGHGGLRVPSEFFTVDDQIVTIPDPGYFTVGDRFSFQYEYEVSDDVLDFEFVAVVAGVYHSPANTLTFTPPPEMEPGDFLLATVRGGVAPGGGEAIAGAGSGDARLSHLFSATPPVMEFVFTGVATASTTDLVVTITPRDDILPGAVGMMLILRGIDGIASTSSDEAGGGATPQIDGTAAIAVTWDGNHSFTVLTATPPDGFTEGGSTGLSYSSTDVSYWYDPAAEVSPAGTYSGEGCLVIGLA